MCWQDRIAVDPNVCHGTACIRGTRVMVTVILDNLAAGESTDTVATAYHVTPRDVQAVLEYAAELAKERILTLPGDAA